MLQRRLRVSSTAISIVMLALFSAHLAGQSSSSAAPTRAPSRGAGVQSDQSSPDEAPLDTLGPDATPVNETTAPSGRTSVAAPEEGGDVVPLEIKKMYGHPFSEIQALAASADVSDRYSAMYALGNTNTEAAYRTRAVKILTDALEDESLQVVAEAADSLASLKVHAATERIVELLGRQPTWFVVCIIRALCTMGDASAIEPLRALGDGTGSRVDLVSSEAVARIENASRAPNAPSRPPTDMPDLDGIPGSSSGGSSSRAR